MFTILALALVGFVLYSFLEPAFRPGLNKIPGPFFAQFTDFWRLYMTWQRRFKDDIPGLHKKYNSTLIRIGPNLVSCSDPRAIDLIYGFHNEMKKSDMVKPMLPIFRGKRQPTMFAASDNKTHGRIRRPVAGAFAMTNVIQFEPWVDQNTKLFFQRAQELFIEPGKECDIHNWVQYFAFDVITEMTMSKSMGFLRQGGDVDGVLKNLQKELDYRGIALAMPQMDQWVRLNPVSAFFKPNQTAHFATRSRKILTDRIAQEENFEKIREGRPLDFTHRFLEAQRKDPSISDGQMIGYVQANLVAGSDTTAIALRTAIYYTLKNPWILERVRKEVDARDLTFPVPFTVARFDLKFSAAVVREALRFHFPLIGLMERECPESGVTLPDGTWLPGGTVVGMQPDLIGRDKGIFGADADEFNPERWLKKDTESEEAFQARSRAMNNADLAFGYGPRACLGKHVAEMEIYKFIPTFFGLLDVNFVKPNEPWKLRQLFIVKQSGMEMYMKWRPGKGLHNLRDLKV